MVLLKDRFKELLTIFGYYSSAGMIEALDGVTNYLEVGRWMRARGFDIPRRVESREKIFDRIAVDISESRVLYLEFGVHRGASMVYWSKLLRSSSARLHGFDSFEGLPEKWHLPCSRAWGQRLGIRIQPLQARLEAIEPAGGGSGSLSSGPRVGLLEILNREPLEERRGTSSGFAESVPGANDRKRVREGDPGIAGTPLGEGFTDGLEVLLFLVQGPQGTPQQLVLGCVSARSHLLQHELLQVGRKRVRHARSPLSGIRPTLYATTRS